MQIGAIIVATTPTSDPTPPALVEENRGATGFAAILEGWVDPQCPRDAPPAAATPLPIPAPARGIAPPSPAQAVAEARPSAGDGPGRGPFDLDPAPALAARPEDAAVADPGPPSPRARIRHEEESATTDGSGTAEGSATPGGSVPATGRTPGDAAMHTASPRAAEPHPTGSPLPAPRAGFATDDSPARGAPTDVRPDGPAPPRRADPTTPPRAPEPDGGRMGAAPAPLPVEAGPHAAAQDLEPPGDGTPLRPGDGTARTAPFANRQPVPPGSRAAEAPSPPPPDRPDLQSRADHSGDGAWGARLAAEGIRPPLLPPRQRAGEPVAQGTAASPAPGAAPRGAPIAQAPLAPGGARPPDTSTPEEGPPSVQGSGGGTAPPAAQAAPQVSLAATAQAVPPAAPPAPLLPAAIPAAPPLPPGDRLPGATLPPPPARMDEASRTSRGGPDAWQQHPAVHQGARTKAPGAPDADRDQGPDPTAILVPDRVAPPPRPDPGSVPQASHTPHGPRAPDTAALAGQLVEALRQDTDGRVELTLRPEELGRLRLTLSGAEGPLVMHVSADNPATLDLIRRNIDSLAQDLRQLGYADVSFRFDQDRRDRAPPQPRTTAPAPGAEPGRADPGGQPSVAGPTAGAPPTVARPDRLDMRI